MCNIKEFQFYFQSLKKWFKYTYGESRELQHMQQLPIIELTLGDSNINDLRPILNFTKLRKVNLPKKMTELLGFKELSENYELVIINE
jgi:hypothetical protein